MSYVPKNKGEAAFIDQYTRKLMVDWCRYALANDGDFYKGYDGHDIRDWSKEQLYREFAQSKGWVNLKKNSVTGKGFGVGASFLRR